MIGIPKLRKSEQRQFQTYSEARDEELFSVERVNVLTCETRICLVALAPESFVARCGEGINDGREVTWSNG